MCSTLEGLQTVWYGSPEIAKEFISQPKPYCPESVGGVEGATPYHGWSKIVIPGTKINLGIYIILFLIFSCVYLTCLIFFTILVSNIVF